MLSHPSATQRDMINQKMEELFALFKAVPVEYWVAAAKVGAIMDLPDKINRDEIEIMHSKAATEEEKIKAERRHEERIQAEELRNQRYKEDLQEVAKNLGLKSVTQLDLLNKIMAFNLLIKQSYAKATGKEIDEVGPEDSLPFLIALLKNNKELNKVDCQKAFKFLEELYPLLSPGIKESACLFFYGAVDTVCKESSSLLEDEKVSKAISALGVETAAETVPPKLYSTFNVMPPSTLSLAKYVELKKLIDDIRYNQDFKDPKQKKIINKLAAKLEKETDKFFKKSPMTPKNWLKFSKNIAKLIEKADKKMMKQLASQSKPTPPSWKSRLSHFTQLIEWVKSLAKQSPLNSKSKRQYGLFQAATKRILNEASEKVSEAPKFTRT